MRPFWIARSSMLPPRRLESARENIPGLAGQIVETGDACGVEREGDRLLVEPQLADAAVRITQAQHQLGAPVVSGRELGRLDHGIALAHFGRGGSSQTTSAPISTPGVPGRSTRWRFQLWSARSASAAGSSGSSRAAIAANVSPGSGWIQRRKVASVMNGQCGKARPASPRHRPAAKSGGVRTLLRILLVAAHLAAGASVCPAPEAGAPAPELLAAYSANALHAHGAEPASADGELRAPCPCGCDEAPATAPLGGPLGVALLPAPLRTELPRAAHAGATNAVLTRAPARLPEPVPKLV